VRQGPKTFKEFHQAHLPADIGLLQAAAAVVVITLQVEEVEDHVLRPVAVVVQDLVAAGGDNIHHNKILNKRPGKLPGLLFKTTNTAGTTLMAVFS